MGRTKGLVFIMGSKGDGKHFVGPGFAWQGLESCCCSGVSEPASKGLAPMGSNPAAVRVFRNRPPKDLRQSDKRFPMQGHLPR